MPKTPEPEVTLRKTTVEEHTLELSAEGLEKVLAKWGRKICYIDDSVNVSTRINIHQDEDGVLHGATIVLRIAEEAEVDTESVD